MGEECKEDTLILTEDGFESLPDCESKEPGRCDYRLLSKWSHGKYCRYKKHVESICQ